MDLSVQNDKKKIIFSNFTFYLNLFCLFVCCKQMNCHVHASCQYQMLQSVRTVKYYPLQKNLEIIKKIFLIKIIKKKNIFLSEEMMKYEKPKNKNP